MKALILANLATIGFAASTFAQTPSVSPELSTPAPAASATFSPASPAPSAALSAAPAITATPDAFANRIKDKVEHKFKRKGGLNITIDGNDEEHGAAHWDQDNDIPKSVVPIVLISMLAIFGAPVAIVAVIMFSSWAKSRSLHRTVRMMVEKGQPVPPELFASRAGAPLRPWYDLRRGIILLAVGVGIIFFFLAVAGWEAGVWAFGLIPAIIGAGYILTWRLANKQENLLKQ